MNKIYPTKRFDIAANIIRTDVLQAGRRIVHFNENPCCSVRQP